MVLFSPLAPKFRRPRKRLNHRDEWRKVDEFNNSFRVLLQLVGLHSSKRMKTMAPFHEPNYKSLKQVISSGKGL